MSLINVTSITYKNGNKKLYSKTSLKINSGEHAALIGPNGCGKTTLFNIILKNIIPDDGDVEWYPKLKIGYLDQHQHVDDDLSGLAYLRMTFKDLYDLEEEISKIYSSIATQYDEKKLIRANKYQEILNFQNFYEIDKKINNLISGIGIEQKTINKPMKTLSGGQKEKILLAKLLLQEDDVLLLDEPTNFLDKTQVQWLIKFLKNYQKAFLIVSHDVDFLNEIAQIIYAVENFKIIKYVGNYQNFLEQSALRTRQYEQARTAQQEKIFKLKDYIARNGARLSTAKSAQSRKKQLEKIDVLEVQKKLVKPNMSFAYKRPNATVVVETFNLEIGYNCSLIKPLSIQIREGEIWIINGFNGIGKTTFLRTLSGEINPLHGKFKLGTNLLINFLHQADDFKDNETPISYLMDKYQDMTKAEAREKIGKFGLKGELMGNNMQHLSGGEQTKVRLAALSLKPCGLLILDEPTNHIDVLAKEALVEAIRNFKGTVLITTHDINFKIDYPHRVLNFEKYTYQTKGEDQNER